MDEWIKKMSYIYTVEYYLAIRKVWNLATCNNMNGHKRYSALWSKSDRERQYPMISLTCGFWKIINKLTKQKTNSWIQRTYGAARWGEEVRGWAKRVKEIRRYTLTIISYGDVMCSIICNEHNVQSIIVLIDVILPCNHFAWWQMVTRLNRLTIL